MLILTLLNTLSSPLRADELALVKRVKDGDNDAFGEIVDRYGKLMFNAALRVLSSVGRGDDLADEITQNSFIKAWHNIRLFRGDCSLATWLYKITVNTARDELRAQARRASLSLTLPTDDELFEWDVPVTYGDTIPEESIERQETIRAVRRAVESLPDDMRRVIVLRDLNDMSYSDIADILGIELGTVKSRLNRARAELKKLLKDGNFM